MPLITIGYLISGFIMLVCVFSPSAELLGTVVVNAKVGNVVLGGDGWLYIAASSEMLRVQTTVRPWVP